MFTATKEELNKIIELKNILKDVTPLPDEPDFFKNDETLLRYLRSRDLKISDAEKMIRHSIEWRRTHKPKNLICESCLECPGAHSFRMIGFDNMRRPVLYSSFNQASKVKVGATEINHHLVYTMENAILAMVPGVHQWVIVFDCSGMSIASCNPKLGHECTQLLSLHYPERLAHAICIRPGKAFKTALMAMKTFMPPVTSKKVHLIKYDNDKQLSESLNAYLDKDTTKWLVSEVSLNGRREIRLAQKNFWQYNQEAEHDPRGTAEYVKEYVENTHPCGHKPHLNIIQALLGKNLHWSRSVCDEAAAGEEEDEPIQNSVSNHIVENLNDVCENDNFSLKNKQERDSPSSFFSSILKKK